MRTKIKNFIYIIKELPGGIIYLMPIIIPYAFIKLVFHTSHAQTFIIVMILFFAITKALDFILMLLDAEISRHRHE